MSIKNIKYVGFYLNTNTMTTTKKIIKELKEYDFTSISDDIYDDNVMLIELDTAHLQFKICVITRTTFAETREQPEETEITHISISELSIDINTVELLNYLDIEMEINKKLNDNYLFT